MQCRTWSNARPRSVLLSVCSGSLTPVSPRTCSAWISHSEKATSLPPVGANPVKVLRRGKSVGAATFTLTTGCCHRSRAMSSSCLSESAVSCLFNSSFSSRSSSASLSRRLSFSTSVSGQASWRFCIQQWGKQ